MVTSSLIFPFTLLHKAPRPSPSLCKRANTSSRQTSLTTPSPLPPLVPWHHVSYWRKKTTTKYPSDTTVAGVASHQATSCSTSSPCFPRAGSGEDRASSFSSSGDGGAYVGKPPLGTAGPVPPSPSSLWITERVDGGGNTLAGSAFGPFTSSSSLLTVLVHTTQPMFTGEMKHQGAPSVGSGVAHSPTTVCSCTRSCQGYCGKSISDFFEVVKRITLQLVF